MKFSVVSSVRHLSAQYRQFIRSTYRLADSRLREQFEEQIESAEALIKGPYVTLARDYERGETLEQLVARQIGHPDLLKLNWPFAGKPLFHHQAEALERADAQERNIIIKTGTGSGKTEAFLLPVLSGVLKMREQGITGTKAILMYPMNALANDQLVRMRSLLRDRGVPLTFALYTGDSEQTAGTLGDQVTGLELTQREQIRANPPDIVLTNFKQLEYLLVRKTDRPLFSNSLRYLVLDEIHSYRGALATEIACLIKRLKARCQPANGRLRCLGTSATVSQDAGGDERLARFASDLFAETFDLQDILGERYIEDPLPATPYDPPVSMWTEKEIDAIDHARPDSVLAAASKLSGRAPPPEGSAADRVRGMLDGNTLVRFLQEETRQPHSLLELSAKLEETWPPAGHMTTAEREKLLQAHLAVGSFGAHPDDGGNPLLRPKLHTFFQGVFDVGLCINPQCHKLVGNGDTSCPDCGSLVFPAVLCRTCGQHFFKARLDAGQPDILLPNDSFLSDEETVFVTDRLVVEELSGEDDEDEQTRRRRDLKPAWICRTKGTFYPGRPANPEASVLEYLVLHGKGNTCPACNQTYTRGDILTLLRTGAASSVSVLTTHHLDKLPEDGRKLLVFADNRQEAAHQAGYTGDRQRAFAIRHALMHVIREAGTDGIALDAVEGKLLDRCKDIGLIPGRLGRDEEKTWRLALSFEATSEFCRSTHQRVSLENLALVAVEYHDLNAILTNPRFVEACQQAGISPDDGIILVRAMLDHMRRARAVGMVFYRQFLNPKKHPWNDLALEPYGVGFPEFENSAVYFVEKRGEAARSANPGGFNLRPLLKDSPRGGQAAIPKLIRERANLGDYANVWTTLVIRLLAEQGILVRGENLHPKAMSAMASNDAWQINPARISLVTAAGGYRCARCQTWRPYLGLSCYGANRCPGRLEDLRPETRKETAYYEQLYTLDVPRRIVAREHTAQISEQDRAKLERKFKEGKIEVLVCSPTLELGVDIGQLHSVLLRNSPPTPANYVQRAGRAGRNHRIGFISTFSGVSSHDRHCFNDPSWLVRGEYRPPSVSTDNPAIVNRHVRSYILEELDNSLPAMMSDFLDDIHEPGRLLTELLEGVKTELEARRDELAGKVVKVFNMDRDQATGLTVNLHGDFSRVLDIWFAMVVRLHQEHKEFSTILAKRHIKLKAAARERAYRELTTDRVKAYALSYFANVGLLPSYQFPTDTFALEPGVGDVPTLRRPAWIALFEFAPGNLVYANGHKLKNIRAFFEGRSNTTGTESSGRTKRLSLCNTCGWATEGVNNECPHCGRPPIPQDIALLENFEAEESLQITSAEEARQRVTFTRHEYLLPDAESSVPSKATLFRYPFAFLEYRKLGRMLLTNWGRRSRKNVDSTGFTLCPQCGKHKPDDLEPNKSARWDSTHTQRCKGEPRNFILGYEFSADLLIFPIPPTFIPERQQFEPFLRTLGSGFIRGAFEMLEIEEDEIAFFYSTSSHNPRLIFYETVPGGAGYLQTLACDIRRWTQATYKRLFNHSCSGACYKCLKSYRNQYFHRVLDKNLIRDTLFQLQQGNMIGSPQEIQAGQTGELLREWLNQSGIPARDTPIEIALLNAIRDGRRLPEPEAQHKIHRADGSLITIPDFAFPDQKIAVYCDGYAYHGNRETLEKDAAKRNEIQSLGWRPIVFWGRTILKSPEDCETQIWHVFQEVFGSGAKAPR